MTTVSSYETVGFVIMLEVMNFVFWVLV